MIMKMFNELSQLVGKRVLLHRMNDDPKLCPIPPETYGTIISIEDVFYEVKWDNGKVVNLLADEDEFEILEN